MATDKQIAANRRNALKSTGPRTAEGKQRSARNATTHGLWASATVVLQGEDASAWDALLEGVQRNLAPHGPIETECVRHIAYTLWRLRRAARVETSLCAVGIEEARTSLANSATYLAAVGEVGPYTPSPDEDTVEGRAWSHLATLRGVLNSLIRWEASLDRRLSRTLVELERLRLMRAQDLPQSLD